jgi:hypothetical protein
MMKKLILTVALSFLIFQFNQAQELTFGVKGGINLASLGGDVPSNAKSKIGFHIGGIAEYMLSDEFGVQAELLYSALGNKVEESIEGVSFKQKTKLSYITLPVVAKYFVTDEIALEAGPQFSFLMSAEIEGEGTFEGQSQSATEDISDFTNGIDLGFGIGGSYKTDGGLFFGLRYVLGLSNINSDGPDTVNNNVLQVSAGYKFN